ncbi:hypothetical protein Tco_1468876, partial [Tanacetum coccineum]
GACVQNVVDSMVPALLHDKNQTFIYESLYIASLFGRALIKQMDKYFNDKDEEALRDVLESSTLNRATAITGCSLFRLLKIL